MNIKTILIIALSLLVVKTTFASDNNKKKKKITVSGYVKDVNDKPLEGVSMIVDDVKTNVTTNKKGFYKIKVKPDTKTLMAYSINHGGIEIEFTGRTKINFVLIEDKSNPNYISPEAGILYNYGYGKVSQKNSTSSMGIISEKEIENNNYADIYQMIKARVPGVFVSGKSITIRGISSMRAQTNPLFIVDGMETASIDYLNPRDVKSISVLKGSSASMYGSKGSMGVIVITLKRGGN